MPRREFDTKTKRTAWDRCHINGVPCCEGILPAGHERAGQRCCGPLTPGRFTYDHVDPDYFSKDNSLENCQVLGWCCDRPKTAKDQGDIAKTKRIKDREIGIKKKRSGFRGWRKMNGEIVWRR